MDANATSLIPARTMTVQGRPKPAAQKWHCAPFHFRYAHPGQTLTAEERHAQLADQTSKWVQTFFGQMLKQMRDSPFKDKLFSGGRGGEAFQEMADQKLSEHMANGTGRKLVDAIVRRIESKGAYAAQAGGGGQSAAAVVRGHDRGLA